MLIGEFQVFLLTWGNLCDYTRKNWNSVLLGRFVHTNVVKLFN